MNDTKKVKGFSLYLTAEEYATLQVGHTAEYCLGYIIAKVHPVYEQPVKADKPAVEAKPVEPKVKEAKKDA